MYISSSKNIIFFKVIKHDLLSWEENINHTENQVKEVGTQAVH